MRKKYEKKPCENQGERRLGRRLSRCQNIYGGDKAKAGISLQPTEEPILKQISSLQPVKDTTLDMWTCPEGIMAHGGTTQEQVYPEGLQPVGRTYTVAGTNMRRKERLR